MRVVYWIVIGAFMVCVPAHAEPKWYKGVTHVHSLWSDGDMAPEMIAAWYKERGYNFVCFSEHFVLQEGEKYVGVSEESVLKPEHVTAIRQKFGDDWLDLAELEPGRPRMRLKTHEELRERFTEPGKFILIPAEEITNTTANVHTNAINLREVIPMGEGDVITVLQGHLDAVRAQSKLYDVPMIAHLNHPNWSSGVTAEEMLAVRGLRFFEVYNGHPGTNTWGRAGAGVPSGDRHWDIVQSIGAAREQGYVLYGVATDDSHNYHEWGTEYVNPGRGWVMVRSEGLYANEIVEAMQRGDYYASTGVTLRGVLRDPRLITVEIDPEPGVQYTVQFIGTRKRFNADPKPLETGDSNGRSRATRQYSDEIGEVLFETRQNPASYMFHGDELYVRARIVSDKLQENPAREGDVEMAWVQPILGR